jgi:hypothetical protein
VAKVLPRSGCHGVPGVCSCAAEKASDLQDTLPNHLVYPRLGRSQWISGLPAIHVERQRMHSHFCLKASYWCSLVGSSNGSEALVLGFLKLFSNPILEECCVGRAPNVSSQL